MPLSPLNTAEAVEPDQSGQDGFFLESEASAISRKEGICLLWSPLEDQLDQVRKPTIWTGLPKIQDGQAGCMKMPIPRSEIAMAWDPNTKVAHIEQRLYRAHEG
jgi:hypothetical protein